MIRFAKDEDHPQLKVLWNQGFGDGVYYFRTESGEGCAVCGWRGQKIFIREIVLLQIDIPTAVSVLHQTLGADEYVLRLPAGSFLNPCLIRLCSLTKENKRENII